MAASANSSSQGLDLSQAFNCPSCLLAIPTGFTFCPRCRALAEGRDYDPTQMDRHEKQYVLSLVLLSLGALAIPRLLRSQAFSRGQKAGLTLLGILNTAGVVVVLYLFGTWFPDYLKSLLQ